MEFKIKHRRKDQYVLLYPFNKDRYLFIFYFFHFFQIMSLLLLGVFFIFFLIF